MILLGHFYEGDSDWLCNCHNPITTMFEPSHALLVEYQVAVISILEVSCTMNLNQPVPELPVSDVQKAQEYYRQYFGCKVEWLYPDKTIGAVSNGGTALFFRKRSGGFEPVVHWIFCENVDASYQTMKANGANIADDIDDKPWGLRQFTVHDLDGNVFYFHS